MWHSSSSACSCLSCLFCSWNKTKHNISATACAQSFFPQSILCLLCFSSPARLLRRVCSDFMSLNNNIKTSPLNLPEQHWLPDDPPNTDHEVSLTSELFFWGPVLHFFVPWILVTTSCCFQLSVSVKTRVSASGLLSLSWLLHIDVP